MRVQHGAQAADMAVDALTGGTPAGGQARGVGGGGSGCRVETAQWYAYRGGGRGRFLDCGGRGQGRGVEGQWRAEWRGGGTKPRGGKQHRHPCDSCPQLP